MNDENIVKDKIYSIIKDAKNIAVLPSVSRGLDSFCAAAGLYYMLKDLRKNVNFIYTQNIPEKYEEIIKKEDITRDIKNRNLLVSIDYSNTDASKVDYYTSQNVLYIKISPINSDFNKDEKVRARVTGFDFDVVFIIGANNFLELGDSFKNLDTLSKISKVINVDNSNKNERYGYVNVVDQSVSSLSLLIMQKSPFWGLKINDKAVKTFFSGIPTHNS